MGLKDLRVKLKAFRLWRFFSRGGRRNMRKPVMPKKSPWMMPVSYGYHVAKNLSFTGWDESTYDSVVAQREQLEELELWFFGVADAQISDRVTRYMQKHMFDKKPKESQLGRKSQEAMRAAYLSARAKLRDEQTEEKRSAGSVSAMVINGEKLVMANMGGYRAVVCRDGVAHQMRSKEQQPSKRHWPHRLIPGRLSARENSARTGRTVMDTNSSELVLDAEKISSETEFVILGSNGLWEVMKSQEAVNLIRHIEDPQVAAAVLANEALLKMGKSNITCLVIRFD